MSTYDLYMYRGTSSRPTEMGTVVGGITQGPGVGDDIYFNYKLYTVLEKTLGYPTLFHRVGLLVDLKNYLRGFGLYSEIDLTEWDVIAGTASTYKDGDNKWWAKLSAPTSLPAKMKLEHCCPMGNQYTLRGTAVSDGTTKPAIWLGTRKLWEGTTSTSEQVIKATFMPYTLDQTDISLDNNGSGYVSFSDMHIYYNAYRG